MAYETFSHDWMIDLGMTIVPAVLRTRFVRRAFYGSGRYVIRTWTPIQKEEPRDPGGGMG